MKRNVIIAGLVAVTVVGGAAVAGTAFAGDDGGATPAAPRTLNTADGDDGRDDDSRDDDNRDALRTDSRAGGGWISAEQAVKRALEAVPGVAHGLDLDDNRVWEVDVLTRDGAWRQVDVARKGGQILRTERDDDGDDDGDDDDLSAARSLTGRQSGVTLADAARIADERVPGTIGEIELERAGTVWKIEFEDVDGRDDDEDVELWIDRASGDVTLNDGRDDHDTDGGRDD
ncbi:PepSY domain-containing protein [Streptomyces alkaliterrae]|uniref:PepSY domain-containing protein n=1 Tax=Streptomyces alkaliterrae TaxID=2213162 RepID=A0A5P0YTZ9_9ACTN|nr:PepSY domain-containing protein [Streptomyces alkaliterrae]MBB1257550.1 PepSY domain-containing protein [Streptomyces alkaliterrae]MQS03793.1 hypothetical protein [Streptomyces alkaliterrae]